MSAPAQDLDRTLAALADPHRRAAVDLLGRQPRTAGDLARALRLPAPAMSRHLKTLRESGLVSVDPSAFDARMRVYALRPKPMTDLLRWLEETERMWSGQLAAFRDHLAGEEPPAEPDA